MTFARGLPIRATACQSRRRRLANQGNGVTFDRAPGNRAPGTNANGDGVTFDRDGGEDCGHRPRTFDRAGHIIGSAHTLRHEPKKPLCGVKTRW